MRGFRIAFFLCLFQSTVFSQLDRQIDSLTQVLNHYQNQQAGPGDSVHVKIADLQNKLSYYYLLVGKTDSAQWFAQQAGHLSGVINYQKGLGVSYTREGYLYDLYADFPKAMESYTKALAIFVEIGDTSEQASALGNMGRIYEEAKVNDKALYYYLEAQKLFEKMNNEEGLSNGYLNIGGMYSKSKNYEEALAYVFKAAELKEKLGDKRGLAIAYSNIGGFYTDLKQYDLAIGYYEKALLLKEELGDKESLAATYCNMGSFYYNQKNYSKADECFSKGYDISKEINSISWMQYACFLLFRTNIKLKAHADAEKYGFEFLEMNKRSVFNNFPIFTEKEKELFLIPLTAQFDKFNSYALKRKNENPALSETVYNTTLTYKGLLLKSSTAMRNAILSGGDKELIRDYENWLELKKQIAKTYTSGKNVALLEERADSIEKHLVRRSAVFSDFEKSQKLTWREVQNSLNPGEAAIEFIHFKHDNDTIAFVAYCALVVKPGAAYPEMIELFRETKLEEILGTFQGNNLNYINSVYGKRSEKNSALYDLIWKPMENSLRGVKKVYLSPAGLLHKVSFAALSKEQDVYLCDNYSIQMVASSAKVALPENFMLTGETAATIFGGINYSTDSSEHQIWNYLEGTETEAQKIAALFAKKNLPSTFLSSASATEAEFKLLASQSNILHIATHGFFYPDPKVALAKIVPEEMESGEIAFRGRGFGYATFVENENPLMRSGLVFAGANNVWSTQNNEGEDGVLTAQEVAHLDMRKTQLIVLSACETGLGDIKGSEGVYGLQRAFKMAGVNYIIMSLWQVPDKETAEFMQLFYKNLLKAKNIPAAFQKTQKRMSEKYDPYYWGAFVLIE
jgi:CHAT domain-containing protein